MRVKGPTWCDWVWIYCRRSDSSTCFGRIRPSSGAARIKPAAYGILRPRTHYPHVTWARVMLRLQLGYLTLNSGAHSHFCHSAYVTWSGVELWSVHMPARLLNFCWRTHFVRRDVRHVRHVSRNVCDNRNLRGVLAREPTRAPRQITWRQQSDTYVSLLQNSMLNIPTALVISRELTWREYSVSPA
jgi:hypothetical protein